MRAHPRSLRSFELQREMKNRSLHEIKTLICHGTDNGEMNIQIGVIKMTQTLISCVKFIFFHSMKYEILQTKPRNSFTTRLILVPSLTMSSKDKMEGKNLRCVHKRS